MNLDAKDVEAIGRARANRTIPSKIKYTLYSGVVLTVIGILYWLFTTSLIPSAVITVVGLVVMWYGVGMSDKRRKKIVRGLKDEWRAEKRGVDNR